MPKDLPNPLLSYIDTLRQMPPPKPMRLVTAEDVNFMKCMCGHRRRRSDMPRVSSGVVVFSDNVCRGCVKKYRDLATVVCAKCKDVLGRVEPGTDPKDRFTFERGAIYHILYCDSCTPGLSNSEVIERILWRRANNIPNPVKSTA